MNTSTYPDTLLLADYARALRRRWYVVVALAVGGVAVAAVVLLLTPKRYMASASVYAGGLAAYNGHSPLPPGALPAIDDEAQFVRSDAVARLAAARLHAVVDPQQLATRVNVTARPNTTILNIGCEAATAAGAAACANAFAAAYLAVRRPAANTSPGGGLLNTATAPSAPSTPRAALLLPSGILGGLIAGLLLAFGLDLRDERRHDTRTPERFRR